MDWYIAKLIFRIICGDGNHQPQFDEQLRLISAENESEALHKARQIVWAEQDSFMNGSQQVVRWEFVNITELYKAGPLTDGAELYYTILETDDAEGYLEVVRQKALAIEAPKSHAKYAEAK